QQRAVAGRLERELKLAGVRPAGQQLLEQKCVRGQAAALFPLQQRRDLVAEAEHAARLEPDERNSALDKGCERGNATLRLAPRLGDEPDCEKGASAAER